MISMQMRPEKGYRSRAYFKIEEIQTKDKLLKPGMTVVDLELHLVGGLSMRLRFSVNKGKWLLVICYPWIRLRALASYKVIFAMMLY